MSPDPSSPNGERFPFHQHLPWLTLAPFVVLSLIILLVFYPDYRLSSNRSAILSAERDRRWEDAIAPLQTMLMIDEGNKVEWHRRLGWAYIHTENYQAGIEHLEAAKALNPKLDLAQGRMICYYHLERSEEGKAYRDRVLKSDPDDPAANYYLALEHLEAGDLKAAGLAVRAAALDPEWNDRAEDLRRRLAEETFTENGAESVLASVPEKAPAPAPETAPEAAATTSDATTPTTATNP